jgi:Spy/CpxP family protein refolding chaperone
MKKLFIVALALVSMAGFAQKKTEGKRQERPKMEKMTPQERSAKRLEKMTAELNLDAKQQEKVKQLFAEQDATRDTQRAEMKKKRDQAKAKMGEQKQKMDDKMTAILTPEQSAKWKANQKKIKDKMQERRGKRKGEVKME